MTCPSCNAAIDDGAAECPSCGIILAKWHRREDRPRTHAGATPVPESRAYRSSVTPIFMILLVLGGAGYAFYRYRSRNAANATSDAVRESTSSSTEFDRVLHLPGSPLGVASNGQEIIFANRKNPWGVVRLHRDGARWIAQPIAIEEVRYKQHIQLTTLTWNGANYVGLASAAWFGSKTGEVFTILHPSTLQIIRTRPAPPLLGALAWDGTSYWASTRRNTADAAEEAFLYKLDREFNVVQKYTPPAVGCQGLAWDGSRLWFVDVFDDMVYVLDVSQPEPRVVHKATLPQGYLSGVVVHDGAIWIADYDNDRLQRLRPSTRAAWLGESPQPAETASASMVGDASIEELRRQLRSESSGERMSARFKLEQMNAPIDFARDENSFIDRREDDTEDLDWSVELRDGGVWLVSSRIWFGHDLFVPHEQASNAVTLPVFARYTFTVKKPDGTETEKQFDATAGENVLGAIHLTDANLAGVYNVSLFIHCQYVTGNGTARILNNSAGSLELKR